MSGRRGGLLAQIDYRIWMLRRATAAPTFLRCGVAVAAFAALVTAFVDSAVPAGGYGVFAAVAVVTALAPRTVMPTAVIMLATVGWLISGADYGSGTGFARLWLLAVLIYLIHSGAAMAAVLPYDALVTPGTFRPWLRRGLIVTGLTGLVAFGIAELPGLIGSGHRVMASIAGLGVTLAIAGYLTLLGRRRRGA
jgi:hypothetical protein